MLVEFDFSVTQTRYVRAAMNQVASFRPDGQTPAQVLTLLNGTTAPRAGYVTATAAISAARAARRDTIETLHDACVDFAAQAKSAYRKNRPMSELIAGLPVMDRNFQETMTRADAVVALWTGLPGLGAPPAPFVVPQADATVSLAAFTTLRDAARAADTAIPDADQAFQKAEAVLHDTMAGLDDFVGAALEQGRSQYDVGTAQREVIDAVPTVAAQQAPTAGVISSAVMAEPGAAKLQFDAPGATSFDIEDKAPGAAGFVTIATDILLHEYTATGLAVGAHQFRMVPRNSRGDGPLSAPVSLTVV